MPGRAIARRMDPATSALSNDAAHAGKPVQLRLRAVIAFSSARHDSARAVRVFAGRLGA
jgi:hypothetical protein